MFDFRILEFAGKRILIFWAISGLMHQLTIDSSDRRKFYHKGKLSKDGSGTSEFSDI